MNKSRTVVTKRYGALSTVNIRLIVFLSFLADKKAFLFAKFAGWCDFLEIMEKKAEVVWQKMK
ncbi:hypothetical protein BHU02_09320 [Latilactobacillus sakei subsp. sakei]|nr:hypothetical protein BHU02_09320 [Latilactobacillus sakei subsp. sakei]